MRHLWILAFPLLAVAEEFPVAPYTDPAELDCPWPRHSHYKQPWRGYIETKSGWEFLNGIGINLQIPSGTDELAIRLLAQAGFRNCRIEIGFGESAWDERKLTSQDKYQRRFALCAKHGLRPTILINAHHGIPCPVRIEKKRLTAPAPAGTKTLVLDDVVGLEAGRSGLSQLTGYWAAEALITAIDFDKREVTLSKSLPRDIPAGDLSVVSLKYPPLHPVGTPEFDETAAGWVAHTLRVCRLARDAGIADFDVEIWNELTFGTHYLNINEYYAHDAPKFPAPQPDPLKAGGRCWELARRTAEAVKAEFPRARCIWGFSNTTFFHTPIDKLPPGIDAQSYHPYGTGTRAFSGNGPRADQPSLEGFVPHYEVRMPEGIAHTFIQTESLMRLLNPLERLTRRPPGTAHFRHYLTEHGVLAEECGIRDDAEAWRLKTLCATRSFCLWLNKGIDVLHYFSAFETDPRSFGLLPVNLRDLPSNARFEEVATPPLRAMANIARAFRGSVFLEKTTPLRIEAIALGEQHKVFEGDGAHPPLWQREAFAALPFQIDPNKHLLAVYVMTRDATKPLAEERYRLRVRGARGRKLSFYDPILNKAIPTESGKTTGDAVEVIVPVVDYPRLLTISRD